MAKPPPRRGAAIILAAAVAFAALTGVFGVLLLADDSADDVTEVRQVAGRFGEAILTFDHEDLDSHRDAVLALATGSFRDEYEDEFEANVRDLITQLGARSQAFAKDVFLSEVDDDTAQAIVVVDTEGEGTGGPRTTYDVYLQVSLVKVGGAWRIDDVADLNLDVTEAIGGASGAEDTSGDDATTDDTSGSPTTSVP